MSYNPAINYIALLGYEWFYDAVRPGFAEEWSWALAPYAIIYWAINGALVSIFFISIPYELLDSRQRLSGVLGATVVFSLNYNLPLLVGG